jgi:tetratricopeptide (TPR) repeat protein
VTPFSDSTSDPTDPPTPGVPPEETITPHSGIDRLLAGGAELGRATTGGWTGPPLLRDDFLDDGPIVRPVVPDRPAADPNRYQLLGEIGRGGMGVVFKGRDPSLGRDLAVKVLKPELVGRPESEQRFMEEVQVSGQLQHPGIVPVYDLGRRADGRPFFAMKLVRGRTLAADLAERPDPAADRHRFLGIFQKACETVAYAHSKGVIHRDLKPGNIMVGRFGEVLVMDWGLAKVLTHGRGTDQSATSETSAEGSALDTEEPAPIRTTRTDVGIGSETTAGCVLGTPAFMPPEQAAGEVERLDERVDVFGLGAVLCVLLTGQPPYVSESRDTIRRMSMRGDLADAFARLDACGADAELIALCKRCLAPDREARPRHAGEVEGAVSAYLAGVEGRIRQAQMDRAKAEAAAAAERKRRRAQVGLAISLVALVGLAAGAVWFIEGREARAREERAAQQARVRAGVESTLDRLPDLYQRSLWVPAQAAVAQAAELVGPEGDPGLRALVDAAARDAALLKELDSIRLGKARWQGNRLSFQEAPVRYAAAFRTAGFDVHGPDPTGVASRVAASPVRDYLIAGLDDWGFTESDPARKQRIFAVTAAATGQDWRLGIPAAWENPRQLAAHYESIPHTDRTPAVIEAIGWQLERTKFGTGIGLLEEGLRQFPGDFWICFRLGDAYMDKRRNKPALAAGMFRVAHTARPGLVVVHVNLAAALREAGEVQASLAELQEALRTDSTFAGTHINIGLALYAERKLAEAVAAFRTAVDVDRNSIIARHFLALGLCHLNETNEAVEVLTEGARLNPGEPEAFRVQGKLLLELGRYADAADAFQSAVRLEKQEDPKRPPPSAGPLREAERLAALDRRVAEIRAGATLPSNRKDLVELAGFCRRPPRPDHGLALRLWQAAFAADSTLERGNQYAAAGSALRLAAGADPGRQFGVEEWYELHRLALGWLTVELAAVRGRSDARLDWWLEDPDLASARDPKWRAAMPADVRARWDRFWGDVEAAWLGTK